MDQGANSRVAMESSLSKQTHMGYVPLACSWNACGALVKREVVAHATKGFAQKLKRFPPLHHHHHHVNRNTYPHDVYPQDGVHKDG
jgi:hypothetical protein